MFELIENLFNSDEVIDTIEETLQTDETMEISDRLLPVIEIFSLVLIAIVESLVIKLWKLTSPSNSISIPSIVISLIDVIPLKTILFEESKVSIRDG